MRIVVALSLALLLSLGSGCASYSSRVAGPRAAFEAGQFDSAIEDLQKLAARQDTDELLYLMDLGTVYHIAGKYKEAVETFQKADKLAEIRDYTSLTEEGGAVLLSDEVVKYKGEDFEKILINVYLAIDYTLLGKYEDALVEARRVNHKLDIMINKGKEPYDRNAFAKYLAAVLFEAQGEWNDAFVDYRQLKKWRKDDDVPYLGLPLLRLADRLKASQELAQFQSEYPSVKDYRLTKKQGEVVLILEQGKAPIKVPSEAFRLAPVFHKRYYGSDYAWLRDSKGAGTAARSHSLYDIEASAIKELDNRLSGIIAKKVAGVVVKQAVGVAVEKATDSKELGMISAVLLHLSDSADTRSWTTLPARLHIARLTLPSGRHDVVLDMVDNNGAVRKGEKRWENVEVKGGSQVFLHYRTRE